MGNKYLFLITLILVFTKISLAQTSCGSVAGTQNIKVSSAVIGNTPMILNEETTLSFVFDASSGGITLCNDEQVEVEICLSKMDALNPTSPVVSNPNIFDNWEVDDFSGCILGTINKDIPKGYQSATVVEFRVRPTIVTDRTDSESRKNNASINISEQHRGDYADTTAGDDDDTFVASYTCSRNQGDYPPNSPCYAAISTLVPVELTSFTAKAKGSNAVLNWETATEANSSHFNVQRSFDGVAFTTIGKVESAGTTQVAQAYSFTDRNASAKGSTLYYRLQQVDADATTSTTEIRVVNFDGNVESKVFPNPASLGSNVQIQGNSIETVQVISIDGKTVADYQVGGKNGFSLPTTDLSAGAYILLVNSEKSNLIIE